MTESSGARKVKLVILLHHRFGLWRAPEWLAERLRERFPELEVVQLEDFSRLPQELAEAEVFFGWSLRPEQFAAARRLRWIHSTAAAVHQLLFPELVESKVVVSNARAVHGPVVAEHALAVLLALAKRLPSAVRHQQARRWAQEQMWHESPPPGEVAGATVGVVGLGSIAREFVLKAKALGMHVLAVREHPERGSGGADEVFGLERLREVLSRSDYVVLAAPLTERTRGLIGRAELAAMRRQAYLINVARGPLIDDVALVDALLERRIAGAGLDVFAEEPLPETSPYWEMESVLLTPHTAALTNKLWERQWALIEENMRRFLAGEELVSVVDKRRGY